MGQINLKYALGKKYTQGFFADCYISKPLSAGYMTPKIRICVPKKQNPIKIIKTKVTSEDGRPDFYKYMLFSEKGVPLLEVNFGEKPHTNLRHVVLEQTIGYKAEKAASIGDGSAWVGPPELFEDLSAACVTQSIEDRCIGVSISLFYSNEVSKENIKNAINILTEKTRVKIDDSIERLIQISEKDIDSIVDELFSKTVLSSHYPTFEEVENCVLKRY